MVDFISVINPATEELIKEIPIDDSAAVAEKAKRARIAQPGWAARSLSERIEAIKRMKELLIQQTDSLASIMTAETGKPISQSRGEISATPQRIDFFIEQVAQEVASQRVYHEPWNALPGTGQLEEVIAYDPLGVVANISAWNYPYFVGTNVFIPALLTGNTVLYKPSEIATMTGLAITDLLHKAGVPEDVFIPIIGEGSTGATLLEQPIDGVFFTGSYATGKKIAITAAPKLIKVQLELGGKDPAYVCDDVDAATAASSLADGAFYNNGQSCCAIERIYVHTDVYEPFLAAFLQTVEAFKLGKPTDRDTYLGPLSRKPQIAILTQQIADAVEKGAKMHTPGQSGPQSDPHSDIQSGEQTGFYFAPIVLTEVTHEMSVMKEESFGPVIGIQRVQSDDEAIALMNDTDYGLTAAVYTAKRERAVRLLEEVNTGSAYWNCCDRVSPRLPWTGRKHSGIGSTLSREGIRVFLQPRSWHLKSL
ncbi:aldehyde dehydrogenase (NAD) family protein [Synechococcus sp. PCC 7335]|uniref:aldehyde dehydrogenase family protein n=1 Tax=Synechococcus sp. (strain ATCC 29403 / PCC 7335) TaxID=91464 RepID=UPI00017EBC07|nr:aldehyde dehydrogenase family protein [Synechococcus sp. PCC 7335]EDX86601.1 aldehyde dehydrogenase (NAD) family protein [Synechococcus sp. PCC 7335]